MGTVCAYARISNEDLNKYNEYSVSIYNQLSLINKYAKQESLKIDKEYIDDGYSGIHFERPGFESLKRDVIEGTVAIIITKDMSRLGRNFMETIYYISDFFPRYNVRYIAINDNYDSGSLNNYDESSMLAIKSIINDRFIKETSIKLRTTFRKRTEDGNYLGIIAPYGYKLFKDANKRTLQVDKYSAKIVKKIFKDIANGKSRRQVAQELNNENILPPVIYMNMTPSKNKKYCFDWSDKTIYRILKNETYMGKTVFRKSVKKDYRDIKRKAIPIRDRKIIPNTHPAIISESLFLAANSMLKTNKIKGKNNYDGLFNDLVVCGVCGRKMVAYMVTKGPGNIRYHFVCGKVKDGKKCTNRSIYDSKLKDIVNNSIKRIILNYVDEEVVVDGVLNKFKYKEKYKKEIKELKRKIEFININIRNLYLQKVKKKISIGEFLERKNELTKIKEQGENLLEQLIIQNNIENKRSKILETYNNFINGNILLKIYIKDLIDKIVIYEDMTIKIIYKFELGELKLICLH